MKKGFRTTNTENINAVFHVLTVTLIAIFAFGSIAQARQSFGVIFASIRPGTRMDKADLQKAAELLTKRDGNEPLNGEIDKLGTRPVSLVNCAVELYRATTTAGDISFNLINPETGNRISVVTTDSNT